ncbi:hypothetical protein H4582DRAFT_2123887 [Lactarius indigo]|nr:hypothetical protein H4582DRAFT_2123887 [Lactarius indigo]
MIDNTWGYALNSDIHRDLPVGGHSERVPAPLRATQGVDRRPASRPQLRHSKDESLYRVRNPQPRRYHAHPPQATAVAASCVFTAASPSTYMGRKPECMGRRVCGGYGLYSECKGHERPAQGNRPSEHELSPSTTLSETRDSIVHRQHSKTQLLIDLQARTGFHKEVHERTEDRLGGTALALSQAISWVEILRGCAVRRTPEMTKGNELKRTNLRPGLAESTGLRAWLSPQRWTDDGPELGPEEVRAR